METTLGRPRSYSVDGVLVRPIPTRSGRALAHRTTIARLPKVEPMSTCRFCGALLDTTFVDLGMSPLSNAFLKESQLDGAEPFYPLHAFVCRSCLLVQL